MQLVHVGGRGNGKSRVMQTITKALAEDPRGGATLAELTVYEAMCDLIDTFGPQLRRDIAKAATEARSSLVRSYVTKRLADEPVDDLLAAAAVLEQVSKEETADQRRRAQANQPRAHGKYTKSTQDLLAAFTSARQASGMKTNDVPNVQAYRNMTATGNALAALGATGIAGNAHLAAAGATAQLVGELGAQAEKVLGPGLRRTAYRYRGTEKTPNASLQQRVHENAKQAQQLGDALANPAQREQAKAVIDGMTPKPARPGGAPQQLDLADASLVRALRSTTTGDDARLAATQDYLAGTMLGRIPDLKHAKLSLAAGKMPPSVGYIVDADGDVVSEAQGVNGDHYLPFDLKNLGALHGGGYVRTRTVGGPTDEDIYTALVTGARRLTTVSHSGVFTLQFQTDLRGGRRNSDKARAMVKRYAELLKEIDSGEHMEQGFDQATIEKLKAQAKGRAPTNVDEQKRIFSELLGEERKRLMFADDTDIKAMAKEQVAGYHQPGAGYRPTNGPANAQQEREAEQELRAEQARVYRLDGHGYQAALEALQQEFPFYLKKPEFEPLPVYLRNRGQAPMETTPGAHDRTLDLGYTKHKALVPVKVQARRDKERPPREDEDGDRPTAAKTPKADAAAAASASSAAAVSPTQIADSPIKRNLRRLVQDQFYELDGQSNALDTDGAPIHGFLQPALDAPGQKMPVEDAYDNNSDAAFAVWAARTYRSPEAATDWLLNGATKEQLAKLNSGLAEGSEKLNGIDTSGLQAMIEQVQHVRFPYAAKVTDPALAQGSEPQQFSDIVVSNAADVQGYMDYLAANPDVAQWAKEFAHEDDAGVAQRISSDVDNYQEIRSWGEKVGTGAHNANARPSALDLGDDDANADIDINAAAVADQGQTHPLYVQLLNMQKGWSALRGLQVAAALNGSALPDLSKVGEAGPKVQARRAGFTKRAPLVVHRLGSPASSALSKALRAPRPSPRRVVPVSTRSR